MKPWKDWPYWLKGGVIGIVVGVMISILNIIPAMFFKIPVLVIFFWGILLMIFMLIFCGIALPATNFGGGILGTCETRLPLYFSAVLSAVIIVGFWFGIGAVIGWITGKIKEKRK